MKSLFKQILPVVAMALMPFQAFADRDTRDFNLGWRFHEGNVDNAASAQLNDSQWRTVDLPHDFQIEQPWIAPDANEKADNTDIGANIKSRLSSRGFKEMGCGWYRKTFTPDASMKGKRVLIDFEGIMYVGDVYLNGERIGGTDYGYVGFDIDLTNKLKYGEPNVIAVKADTREPLNSRWYTGGGIFRDVKLVVTDRNYYFTRHGLYLTTPKVSANKAILSVLTEFGCYDKNARGKIAVGVKVTDAMGNPVADLVDSLKFYRGQKTNEYHLPDIEISNPHLWNLDDPYLYNVELTLYNVNGQPVDHISHKLGIRTIEYGPDYGFKLNGKKVLLKGIANHHTLGALGAAVYDRAIEKRIQLLKQFGFNHIRTSHNPYSTSLLDLCDKYGILVVDELYDKWLDQYCGGREKWENLWQHDVPEFIKRDRNHPSVIMWSLGNELQGYWNTPHADWGVTPYRMQRELLHRYDNTRPVTVAMHPRYRNVDTDSLPAPLVMETDIAAYNYRYMYFPGDGKRFPWMKFYQSEASTAAMGQNYFEMDLDKVIGLAYWGAIDYLGESGGWPAKGWAQGVFDISLEPKPSAYFIKSYLKDDEPLVHIAVIEDDKRMDWNGIKVGVDKLSDHWNYTEGDKLSLFTYTNADEVELFINGKSIGTKKNNRADSKARNRIKWDNVTYKPGNIEAVARTAGKIVARHRIETAGKAVALRVEPDNASWQANGYDLQHLRITAVDSKGRRAYTADNKLHFAVEGDARIVAVSNGDITSDELNAVSERSLFHGSALVILRAGQSASKITLTTSADGFKSVKTKLQTK